MLIFLGLVGLVVSAIALYKGSLPSLGIKTRNVGVIVLVVSSILFAVGLSLSSRMENVSEYSNIENSQDIVVERDSKGISLNEKDIEILVETCQSNALGIFTAKFDGIGYVELDRQSRTFNFIPTNENFILSLTMINSGEALTKDWNFLVDSFVSMSKSITEVLPGYALSLVNPASTDKTLLMVEDGVVLSNFVK